MSEKEITVSAAQALYDELWADCERAPHEEAMILARHIAAAEERGRRRGVEEANDLRELLREARAYLSLRKLKGKITEHESNLLLRLDPVALAPRDSAPTSLSDTGAPVKELTREEAVAMFGPRKDRP